MSVYCDISAVFNVALSINDCKAMIVLYKFCCSAVSSGVWNLFYEIKPRRAGDIAMCYADPAKAARVLGWKAEKGLDEMCADSWRWQSQNPNGYEK